MRYSKLLGKTSKTAPHDAESVNARLLVQGGFVDQLMAGVYTYLPLGLRVIDRVKEIVREEMNRLGAQEILMPALQPREPWETTGRWTDPGPEVMFQFKGRGDKDLTLGWTHEEIVTPTVKRFVRSYKDLPFSVYQIQDKFRNEPRAKSGLLRGREFSMKDLYSFHLDEADLDRFYELAKEAYRRVYDRCGLHALIAEASGGAFTKYSHEFQVLTESGEDIIYYCEKCEYAQNREISEYKEGDRCPKCGGIMREGKAIEVGNIFKLMTRFSDPFELNYTDADGVSKPVLMGCYGLGPSRVMGTVIEVHHDDKGIIWPKAIAPYLVHLVSLTAKDEAVTVRVRAVADKLVDELEAAGVSVLYDDREDARAGEKFADADLIGCPLRLVVSEKTLAADSVEWKERVSAEAKMVPMVQAVGEVGEFAKK
ncbi:MAG: His/Gly/Thr/Pro-type tRNA ligase C-terminal domain-containing protein [Patescibacteria group bacterium]|nr:His/Gly/Thr/Pro-type tRNA ligase C-terminal domain-containing protein [Patescibacteria group bacterium]